MSGVRMPEEACKGLRLDGWGKDQCGSEAKGAELYFEIKV